MSNTKVLIVAEHDGAKLNPATAKGVTCARGLTGAEITVVVCAADAAVRVPIEGPLHPLARQALIIRSD